MQMDAEIKIIYYPDPRLRKVSEPVKEFGQPLRELAGRMLELMREARGVGLAAPQVGRNVRLFVMNPSGQEGDDHAYVNPVLRDAEGEEDGEEGCLSLPQINAKVWRSKRVRMRAQDLEGNAIEEIADGYVA